jgi:hypothetical protein
MTQLGSQLLRALDAPDTPTLHVDAIGIGLKLIEVQNHCAAVVVISGSRRLSQ